MQPLPIALIGLGTVGSGVAQVLLRERERIARRAGREIELRHVVVRDPRKPRGVELPAGVVTTDVRRAIDDPEVKIAVELMGGIHPAREVVLALLESGKDIVTANKALLCEHGPELFGRARELGRSIAFEAAVAGGIPIIATVGQCLAANQITSIAAILNGTSNFILTEMTAQNRAYRDALAHAQALGYAEADPTMDVDGTDAAQKLVVLTQLAFGARVRLEDFPRQGIDTLELADLKYARELGYTVKLLAVSRLVDGKLEMHVSPTLVRHHTPLAEVQGPFNALGVTGDVVGETWYFGRGAGKLPTASAVLADIIDTAVGRSQLTFARLGLWNSDNGFPLQAWELSRSRYYLRFTVADRPHVLADIADILGRHQISIASVIQHEAPELGDAEPPPDERTVPLVIMTHRTTAGNIRAAEEELDRLSAVRPPWVRMRVGD